MQNHSPPQTNSHSKLLLFSDSLLVVYNKCNITSTKYTLLKINTTTSSYIYFSRNSVRTNLRSYLNNPSSCPTGISKHSKTINKNTRPLASCFHTLISRVWISQWNTRYRCSNITWKLYRTTVHNLLVAECLHDTVFKVIYSAV